MAIKQKTILKLVLAALVLYILYNAYVNVPQRNGGEAFSPFLKETYPYQEQPGSAEGLASRPVRMGPSNTPNVTTPPLPISTDLLPKPVQEPDNWGSSFAPKEIQASNLLTAVQAVGTDTIGSSLKIANHDLRSAPEIPRVSVGPWMGSSVEHDPYRRPLESC